LLLNSLKYGLDWIPDPRSGIREKTYPGSGSKGQRSTGTRIPPGSATMLYNQIARLAFILCALFNTASSDTLWRPSNSTVWCAQFWRVFSQERERFLLANNQTELLMIGCTQRLIIKTTSPHMVGKSDKLMVLHTGKNWKRRGAANSYSHTYPIRQDFANWFGWSERKRKCVFARWQLIKKRKENWSTRSENYTAFLPGLLSPSFLITCYLSIW
jgi:hypothetical protein